MADSGHFVKGLTLYFVRHGETDWNAESRYQGQADIPLNDKGRAQAARNGSVLKATLKDPRHFQFIASPLIRAQETMEIIRTGIGLPLHGFATDPLLKELSYGHWQGVLQSELAHHDPEGAEARNADPYRWRPRGGESYADLVARTERWLKTVDRDSVVVAHGGTLRCLHKLLLGHPDRDVPELFIRQDRILAVKDGQGQWL